MLTSGHRSNKGTHSIICHENEQGNVWIENQCCMCGLPTPYHDDMPCAGHLLDALEIKAMRAARRKADKAAAQEASSMVDDILKEL